MFKLETFMDKLRDEVIQYENTNVLDSVIHMGK